MATWVLVLLYTEAMAVVPGYTTEMACRAAAAEYVASDLWAGVRKAECLTGPTK